MNLRIFIYHTFGTIAGTKINYPGIGLKKQIQGVNNKLNKNFQLKKTLKPKERFSSPAEHSTTVLFFSEFSVFHFFPKVSSSTIVKSVLEKVKHHLCQENECIFIFHEMHSLYLCTINCTQKSYSIDVKPKEQMKRNCKGNSKENFFFSHSLFFWALPQKELWQDYAFFFF